MMSLTYDRQTQWSLDGPEGVSLTQGKQSLCITDQDAMHRQGFHQAPLLSRRTFLGTTAAAAVAGYGLLSPMRVAAASASLPRAGQFGVLQATAPGGIDLYLDRQPLLVGGKPGTAITINGSIPGPVIRFKEGEEAIIRVHNRMDESTSIHWHGIILPFTMDGVPGISFEGIKPRSTFTYRYRAQQAGTYWYHSHTGFQEQLGHYGMLIFDPADPEPVDYDLEYPVVLSDWTFEDPRTVFRNLKTIEGYYNFQRPTWANIDDSMQATDKSLGEVLAKRLRWDRMRMDPTDILDVTGATYTYLMNGRAHWENPTLSASPSRAFINPCERSAGAAGDRRQSTASQNLPDSLTPPWPLGSHETAVDGVLLSPTAGREFHELLSTVDAKLLVKLLRVAANRLLRQAGL